MKPMYSEDITLRKVKISELLINLHFVHVFLQLIRKFANMNTIDKCMVNLDCKRHHTFAFFFRTFSTIKYGLRFFLFPKFVYESVFVTANIKVLKLKDLNKNSIFFFNI